MFSLFAAIGLSRTLFGLPNWEIEGFLSSKCESYFSRNQLVNSETKNSQIDFTKYRTPELVGSVLNLVDIRGIYVGAFMKVVVGALLLGVVGAVLFCTAPKALSAFCRR